MDHPDPKTRTEKKGGKTKNGPYSSKHVRIMQALAEAKANGPKATGSKK
jgi:hypothetical protein